MAPHSSTLAWKIPWTEEPGRLQSMGSQRVGHWATSFHFSLSSIGEGNGNPLQCSCLENPWTKEPGGLHTVRGVTKSWTRLKRVSSPLATNVRVDPAGGGRGHEHRGHFRLFSPCFQESLTTYPSTTSTSQPTSHSTKRRWTELLSNVPKGWLELFFHIVWNLCQKKVGIFNATILLVKIWKPQCKINDANCWSLNVCDPWKKSGFSRPWWRDSI